MEKGKKSSISSETIKKLDAKGLHKRYKALSIDLNRIGKNIYGKNMEKNLYKLGKTIVKQFYNYLFVYFDVCNGKLNYSVRILKS